MLVALAMRHFAMAGTQVPITGQDDALGWALSILGPTPHGATRANFYAPLLALYARWCHELAGSRNAAPYMCQATWVTNPPAAGVPTTRHC